MNTLYRNVCIQYTQYICTLQVHYVHYIRWGCQSPNPRKYCVLFVWLLHECDPDIKQDLPVITLTHCCIYFLIYMSLNINLKCITYLIFDVKVVPSGWSQTWDLRYSSPLPGLFIVCDTHIIELAFSPDKSTEWNYQFTWNPVDCEARNHAIPIISISLS